MTTQIAAGGAAPVHYDLSPYYCNQQNAQPGHHHHASWSYLNATNKKKKEANFLVGNRLHVRNYLHSEQETEWMIAISSSGIWALNLTHANQWQEELWLELMANTTLKECNFGRTTSTHDSNNNEEEKEDDPWNQRYTNLWDNSDLDCKPTLGSDVFSTAVVHDYLYAFDQDMVYRLDLSRAFHPDHAQAAAHNTATTNNSTTRALGTKKILSWQTIQPRSLPPKDYTQTVSLFGDSLWHREYENLPPKLVRLYFTQEKYEFVLHIWTYDFMTDVWELELEPWMNTMYGSLKFATIYNYTVYLLNHQQTLTVINLRTKQVNQRLANVELADGFQVVPFLETKHNRTLLMMHGYTKPNSREQERLDVMSMEENPLASWGNSPTVQRASIHHHHENEEHLDWALQEASLVSLQTGRLYVMTAEPHHHNHSVRWIDAMTSNCSLSFEWLSRPSCSTGGAYCNESAQDGSSASFAYLVLAISSFWCFVRQSYLDISSADGDNNNNNNGTTNSQRSSLGGLLPDEIDRFPQRTLTPDSIEDPCCSICLSPLEPGDTVLELLPCRHSFHPDCVRDWLANDASCPLCRSRCELPLNEELQAMADREYGPFTGIAHFLIFCMTGAIVDRRSVVPTEDPEEDASGVEMNNMEPSTNASATARTGDDGDDDDEESNRSIV